MRWGPGGGFPPGPLPCLRATPSALLSPWGSQECTQSLSCVRLCDPVDRSPPGPSVHGIVQARMLEWAGMPSSRGSS